MWSGSSVPGKSTVPSGNSGMSGTGSTVLSRDVITLVLHGELRQRTGGRKELAVRGAGRTAGAILEDLGIPGHETADRKSTRLNSSHLVISYAVFCLKKKKKTTRVCACDP